MPRITNKYYKEFMTNGVIDCITYQETKQAIENASTSKHAKAGQAYLAIQYATGARPAEILNMMAKDVSRKNNKITLFIKPVKNGLPRNIDVSMKNIPFIKLAYNYAKSLPEDLMLFWNLRSQNIRYQTNKKGETKKYIETSRKIRYHLQQWFKGVREENIIPYFLRHSRFSNLAQQGADLKTIQLVKGSKSDTSIKYYIHLSKDLVKKACRLIK